ncbi:transcriptional regulator NosR [Aquisalimonas sp.]|uniref:transcriptional regulator NosR n=1 Tax=Aquisalimonas sp. TaxID=1872621 RepID=UPI0025C0A867|nr:NosR/NirI family protein [Aquisalimonas sp.]
MASLLKTLPLAVCLWAVATVAGADPDDELRQQVFPEADRFETLTDDPPAFAAYREDERLGLVFETIDVAPVPAYSGKPVNMLVGLHRDGKVTGVEVLDHEEPIMLVGISEERLAEFTEQYVGKSIHDRVRVGLSARKREGYEYVDALSGATVTVVVMGETVMQAARRMAVAHGLVDQEDVGLTEAATVRPDAFEPLNWQELRDKGGLARLHLTRGEVDDAFVGTDAEGVDAAPEDARDATFIDLYAAYLNTPATGRNLLGEGNHDRLMARLGDGEHAIMLMADGRYSFKGSGFVRGGIFDRFQVHQGDTAIRFRDADLVRAPSLVVEGAPSLSERDIFIVREEHLFDPGQAWELELLVRRQVGALDSEFVNFGIEYDPPEAWFDMPRRSAMEADDDRPLWVSVWEDRVIQIGVLGTGLAVLVLILLFQDWLTRRPTLLHRIRVGFLIYTVVFIGWYALAQLSVVNIFTFSNAVFTDFQWSTFLMDPLMFIMWSFVGASLLLWGRGVYCGWLCPFGAMQELINQAARRIRVPQIELPFSVHERLWALKYIILLVLFGISLQSLSTAEVYAEVEPFKTAVTMHFQREWGFVLYAVVLLAISAVNHKFYCRYICPLGAGLAIPARLRLFDWLKRHKECGSPCQICANECEIKAIHPDGRINPNECHYCLECQVLYWDDHRCPPMIQRRKRREKATRVAGGGTGKPPPKEVFVPAPGGGS